MAKSTPCQELDYNEGDLFQVTGTHHRLNVGELVELDEDDNSDVPGVRILEGEFAGDITFIRLSAIKKLGSL